MPVITKPDPNKKPIDGKKSIGSKKPAFDIKSIFSGNVESNAITKDNTVLDSNWISSRFMVPDLDLDPDVANIRYDSIASLKFTDSSLGGNIFVNPKPQFNPLTDPKVPNTVMAYARPNLDPNLTNTGMGEGYSDMIDDNQQVVFMEFGLPKFNSLLDFFFRAVDYRDSVLANTGRPSTMYDAGKVIGTVGMFIAFPILTATVMAVQFLISLVKGSASLKYYYFEAKMPMYWGVVNTLVTQLVTEQGLLSPVLQSDKSKATATVDEIGMPAKLHQSDIDYLNAITTETLITPGSNYINVYGIVTKAQRAAIKQKELIYKQLSDGAITAADISANAKLPVSGIMQRLDSAVTFGTYLKNVNKHDKDPRGDLPPEKAIPGKTKYPNKEAKFVTDPDSNTYLIPKDAKKDGYIERMVKSTDASLRQGGAYAVFAVDYTGSTTESFSNSTTSINLGDQAKQISNKSRALSYDLARGNIFGGVVGDITSGIKDLANGVLDGVTFNLSSVIQSMMGNAYIEVPKRWDDSSMSFQQHSYSIQLRSPYNSFLSQLQNIYIPLCMLLGGVLPLATGKSSYTSPFLCTLFSKGLENIQLGMLTSLSINRGTTNLGFDKKRNALAIDVSFTVTDFSTLVTSPVNSSIYSDFFAATMEDDTPLGNYISVLGGRDIITSKYSTKRVKLRLSKKMMRLQQVISPDRIGLWTGNTLSNTLGALVSARDLPPQYK